MKTINEITKYIEERILDNKDSMDEIRRVAGTENPGFGMAYGGWEELLLLKVFIEEDPEGL